MGSGRGAQVEEGRRNKRRRKRKSRKRRMKGKGRKRRKGRKGRIWCPYRLLFCINYLELSFDLLLL